MTPKEVSDTAELVVRRYMDDLHERTLPRLLKAVVKAHDESGLAHGGVEARLSRLQWTLVGFAAAGGAGGGFGLARLLL